MEGSIRVRSARAAMMSGVSGTRVLPVPVDEVLDSCLSLLSAMAVTPLLHI